MRDEAREKSSEGRYANALDSERREHPGDVMCERVVRHDDHDLVRSKSLWLLESEVGHPVQPHSRLPASGASLDRHEPSACLFAATRVARQRGNERELLLVEERGDRRKMLIAPQFAVGTDAEAGLGGGPLLGRPLFFRLPTPALRR